MSHEDIQRTDPRLLARFMAAPDERDTWAAQDLAAMVRHQLAAPLVSDLEAAFAGSGPRVAALAASSAPPIASFGDLLAHPSPPVELLGLVKDLAKSVADGHGDAWPHEVASYFYFASIAAAPGHASPGSPMTACGQDSPGCSPSRGLTHFSGNFWKPCRSGPSGTFPLI